MRIVRTSLFTRSLKRLGASAADLQRLEAEIAANPAVGAVIQGVSGARKVRFAMAGRGKSGGGRAIYEMVVRADTAYLLLAYSKKDQADLSTQQRKMLTALVKELTDD